MVETLTSAQKYLAVVLKKSEAFKEGSFKLKVHDAHPEFPLSPYYISMREADVKHGYFPFVCDAVAIAIHKDTLVIAQQVDFVVGIPKAGDPLAEAYSLYAKLPALKMEKYEEGTDRRITSTMHGDFREGQTVLGIDDLITAADTKLEFVEGLEANRLVLAHMAVGLDREQGGMQRLRDEGISVSAALTVSQLLDYYVEKEDITPESYKRIRTYIDSKGTKLQ